MTTEFEKHKEAFLLETHSHLEVMNAALLKLERMPSDSKQFHDIFRAIHTLKSMSAAMNFNQIANLCHALEDLLDAIRNNRIKLGDCVDDSFLSFDIITKNLKEIEKENKEITTENTVKNIRSLIKHQIPNNVSNNATETDFELVESAKIEKVQSIEVKVDRLDILLKLVEELLVDRMKLENIRDSLNNPELSAAMENMGRVINELQYNVMKVRMVSIGFIFNQFPRMIRDLAKRQKKKVKLSLSGSDIELDRSIIDEISESLMHLVRNAIDHGLETEEERIRAHKSPVGEIWLSAASTKEFVSIEVKDDGRGLDWEAIKQAAENKGIHIEGTADEKITNALFSGLSTRHEVTDLSGRGLGLNIVKNKIEAIDGIIRIKSEPGIGTTFMIEIPLTLAVMKTLFVRVLGRIYAVPLVNIERLVVTTMSDFKAMMNNEAIILGQHEVPIIRLPNLFGGGSLKPTAAKNPIVVIRRGEDLLGLAVDELMSTQEIVIKPLNRVVKENRFFSGSTIIGSGEIVLILDVAHLFSVKRKVGVKKEGISQ